MTSAITEDARRSTCDDIATLRRSLEECVVIMWHGQ